jgi:hypothetical protein
MSILFDVHVAPSKRNLIIQGLFGMISGRTKWSFVWVILNHLNTNHRMLKKKTNVFERQKFQRESVNRPWKNRFWKRKGHQTKGHRSIDVRSRHDFSKNYNVGLGKTYMLKIRHFTPPGESTTETSISTSTASWDQLSSSNSQRKMSRFHENFEVRLSENTFWCACSTVYMQFLLFF